MPRGPHDYQTRTVDGAAGFERWRSMNYDMPDDDRPHPSDYEDGDWEPCGEDRDYDWCNCGSRYCPECGGSYRGPL